MKLGMASLVALFCLGSAIAEAKDSASTPPKKTKTAAASKECSAKDKKAGKCVNRGGSRAPASVSIAAEASVRGEAVDKTVSTNPNDPGDK